MRGTRPTSCDMASNYGKNENVLSDVILYLQTVLVAESLSERAEMQRQQLLEKLCNKEMSSSRHSYMDMNGRTKCPITKSNSFACLHQQAYEELQPIYNNLSYEDDDGYGGGAVDGGGDGGCYVDDDDDVLCGYEPFAAHFAGGKRGPPKTFALSVQQKRHSAPNSAAAGDSGSSTGSLHRPQGRNGGGGGSLGGHRSGSDTSDGSSSTSSSKCEVISVSANAVKYSASKYGALTKRERILFVDHVRKYWAAVLASTMYVYGGEREPKPCLVVHLDGYAARDANGGGRNKEWAFEIVCPGKKCYQFIAQNQKDMHSWIEAINNSCSKPATPEIVHSASPICFKQELMPNRELPVPPTSDSPTQDYCYDKPNPIIRPVNLYDSPTDGLDAEESIYHFIAEPKRKKDTSPKNDDKQFWDGDTSYYNVPNNIPVPVESTKEDRNNNNDYDGYFTAEKETCYDIITNTGREMTGDPVLGVQQIIQKIEEINGNKSSSSSRKSQPKVNNSGLVRNSAVYCSTDNFFEPMKPAVTTTMPNNVSGVCCSQSFRKSR